MSEVIIYRTSNKHLDVSVKFEKDTVWLSQRQMSELFDKDSDTIGLHLKNIYSEKELDEKSTSELFSVVQTEGKRKVSRKIKFYNLDAIISVGYRVNKIRYSIPPMGHSTVERLSRERICYQWKATQWSRRKISGIAESNQSCCPCRRLWAAFFQRGKGNTERTETILL